VTDLLHYHDIECPYCGESIAVQIDLSAGNQNYIEDCQVCCRPMEIQVAIDQQQWPAIVVSRDDD